MRLALVVLTVAIGLPHPLTAVSQAPQPEQAPAPGKVATVTGCLARGVDPKTFILKNVAWQSSNPSSAGQARGSSSSSAAAANPPATTETLRLAGAAATLGLEAYVGHTISATGALAKTNPPASSAAGPPEPQGDTTARTRAAEEQAAASRRIFDVRSVTDVGAGCR